MEQSDQSGTEEPLATITTHGANGYREGCRCFVCRRGHADKQAKYRRKRDANDGQPLKGGKKIKLPQNAGPFEIRVRNLLAELAVEGEEAGLHADIMIMNAKLLDGLPTNGRWHLAAGAQRSILASTEALQKIKAAAKSGPDPAHDLEGFLNGLSKPDSSS